VAITADTASERAYLDALASKLKLDPALVERNSQGGWRESRWRQAPVAASPFAYTPIGQQPLTLARFRRHL
jgi:hypothetical protein